MILIDKATGEEYEFRGDYRTPQQGDTFLDAVQGNLEGPLASDCYGPPNSHFCRAILYPVAKRHTIGGVVFEEVDGGRPRQARSGEFTLFDIGFVYVSNFVHDSAGEYIILRPVALESVTGGN